MFRRVSFNLLMGLMCVYFSDRVTILPLESERWMDSLGRDNESKRERESKRGERERPIDRPNESTENWNECKIALKFKW